MDERFHGLPNLVPRTVSIDTMHLVEVDSVGLEAAEACFAIADYFSCVEKTFLVGVGLSFAIHGVENLGRENDLIPAASFFGKPVADDLLGHTFAGNLSVHIGCVEKVNAGFEGGIHDRMAVLFARIGTEVHGAETETRDTKAGAAKVGVFHGWVLYG